MGEIEELGREEAKWMVKRQELENRRKALEPKAAKVNYGEETEPWVFTPEKATEVERVDREIKETEARLREIRDKWKKLRNQSKGLTGSTY